MKRSSSEEFKNTTSKKLAIENAELGDVSLLHPVGVIRNSNNLIELATEIQKADSFIRANACNKLQVIAQQVQFLQQQAQHVLLEAKKNSYLHSVACNFVKVIGNTYHLYKKPCGQQYFSMLSLQEWNGCPHEFIGSFRLEHDQSLTPVQQIEKKDEEINLINKILMSSEKVNLKRALNDIPMDI